MRSHWSRWTDTDTAWLRPLQEGGHVETETQGEQRVTTDTEVGAVPLQDQDTKDGQQVTRSWEGRDGLPPGSRGSTAPRTP